MGLFLAYLNAALSSSWLWLVVLSVTLYWIYMRVLVIYYDTSIDRTDDKTFLVTGAETGSVWWHNYFHFRKVSLFTEFEKGRLYSMFNCILIYFICSTIVPPFVELF